MAIAFGVDVGGTTIKIGCFDGETLRDKWEIPTVTDNDGAAVLPDIAAAVKGYLEAHGIAPSTVRGIGIGVPGAVLEGGIVNRCINLGWGVVPVADELSALTGFPVRAANDANAAALGELWQGGGRGLKNIVMITLGTGIGGGVVIDGRILPGAFGAAGEVGHFLVNPHETEICGCGKKGCLEQYGSATGVVRLAGRYLASHEEDTVLRSADPLTAKAVFDAAKAGDKAALAIVDQVGRYLGMGLSYISCVVDPEAFVIGGGVSRAGTILLDTVAAYYRKSAFHASRETRFLMAELGNDAGMYGAVRMVLAE